MASEELEAAASAIEDNRETEEHVWGGLGEPEYQRLVAACAIVEEGLHETPFLVGSALDRRDFRDVDVRVILSDEKWVALLGDGSRVRSSFYVLLCMSISTYLSAATGLPVDFQVQRESWVKEEDWNRPREALTHYTHNRPDWSARRRC